MQNNDTNTLLKACQANDRNAQYELYRRYYGYAFTIANRYCNEEENTKEVVQDVFVKCFNGLKKYNFEYHFEPWFKKIVINTCIDKHRSSLRQIETVELDNATNEGNVAESLINADAEHLLALVRRLSPAYRTCFSMYAIEGYEYQEIADMLNINIGSVRSNISKARQYLKNWILDEKIIKI
jgi:RNA polymerase sigma factor (sigma-70 family)